MDIARSLASAEGREAAIPSVPSFTILPVNLSCPWCGEKGHDREPLPPGRGGPDYKPPAGKYAFEVRGVLRSRPVRKCLTCRKGIRVTILPPRFRKIPSETWVEMERFWAEYKAGEPERRADIERVIAELQERRAANAPD